MFQVHDITKKNTFGERHNAEAMIKLKIKYNDALRKRFEMSKLSVRPIWDFFDILRISDRTIADEDMQYISKGSTSRISCGVLLYIKFLT